MDEDPLTSCWKDLLAMDGASSASASSLQVGCFYCHVISPFPSSFPFFWGDFSAAIDRKRFLARKMRAHNHGSWFLFSVWQVNLPCSLLEMHAWS
jgi:hypothetical protein